jgi:hypothetical protein
LNIEPKIFAKFDLDTLNKLSLLPVDVVRFVTVSFSRERNRYVYTGSKRLDISDEDRSQLLNPQKTDYKHLIIDINKRRHFERLHEKFPENDPANYPVIPFYDEKEQKTELIQPVSQYRHPYHTPDIHYTLNEKFIDQNNRFRNGYRDVCVDALNILTGRYSRFFFVYLSGDKYEFHFSVEKLRKLLDIEEHYKKRSSINLIFECVKKELKKIDVEFDYAFCTQAEWELHKQRIDHPDDPAPEAAPGKNKKRKIFTKNFWFRAKGMDKYHVPKGIESVFSRDSAGNREYSIVRTYFNKELKMTDNYIGVKWDFIKRYVNKWGAKALIDFASMKMNQMAKQNKKPQNSKAVLMSLIINKVKDLDKEGQGQSTLFSVPEQDTSCYDPHGKSIQEIREDYKARFGYYPEDSS